MAGRKGRQRLYTKRGRWYVDFRDYADVKGGRLAGAGPSCSVWTCPAVGVGRGSWTATPERNDRPAKYLPTLASPAQTGAPRLAEPSLAAGSGALLQWTKWNAPLHLVRQPPGSWRPSSDERGVGLRVPTAPWAGAAASGEFTEPAATFYTPRQQSRRLPPASLPPVCSVPVRYVVSQCVN
jgi:hypothetical protein